MAWPKESHYARYQDNGCHYYPRCLSCPLSRCVHDIGVKRALEELEELGLPLPKPQKEHHGHYYIG